MKKRYLLALLPASAWADGLPAEDAAQQILQETESHIRELRHLNATNALLEIQLEIAKKLHECRQTGYPCVGAEAAPSPHREGASVPQPVALPRLIGTFQGQAQLQLDDGRQIEVRAGQNIGSWKVRAVEVDALQLQDDAGRRFWIPIEREAP